MLVLIARVSVAWAADAEPKNSSDKAAVYDSNLNLLLFEVRLDRELLADTLSVYEINNDLLLPLGELARMLTLGINVDGRSRSASGFILEEDRVFRLDTASQTITLKTGSQPYEADQVRWIDGDLYVASRLLQRWWPINFQANLNTLSLEIVPREKLPLQYRLERERKARGLRPRGNVYEDPGYPRADRDYKILSMPFIDQTLGVDVTRSDGENTTNSAYSAYLTGDLLGMEASAYITSSKTEPDPDVRMTLSRNDPDSQLLGPARARSLMLGNITVPAFSNVLRGGSNGDGIMLSNRPLNQPSSYGLQTLRGELPPGWDVTLYFNDALIGFQQSRQDGLYVFEDQPLVYGTNEFRLVFNGPQGQNRVERKVFVLDQTLTKPGEFFYQFANQWAEDGKQRRLVQFDVGLSRFLSATAGSMSLPLEDSNSKEYKELNYNNIGLRSSMLGMLLNADYVNAEQGGSLYELGVKTGLGRFSLDYTHTGLTKGFVSDFFPVTTDPIKTRDRARLTGSIPLGVNLRLPVALDVKRDETYGGLASYNSNGRISLNLLGTSFTNSINWQSSPGSESGSGALQVSRRLAGIGVSGQAVYIIKPEAEFTSYAMTVDKNFGQASRASLGILHNLEPSLTTYTAGLRHNFGGFGIGVSMRYSTDHDVALGFQIFTALGRNPRDGRWMNDWQQMAGTGAISARAFLDANMNNQFDAGEQPIENASFIINEGSRHPARTDSTGHAYLSRMMPKQYADIAIDKGSLEDPQWIPSLQGIRVLPRAGKVHTIDFPVVMTGEIDGTVYLVDVDGKKRGIGNAEIDLVAADGSIVSTVRSANDGYYIIPAVKPGNYQVRVSPEQLEKLGLGVGEIRKVVMQAKGDFISGLDFNIARPAAKQP